MLVIRSILILLAISGLIYLGTFLLTDKVPGPCAPSGTLGRCYHTKEDVCEVVLAQADKTCKAWIKKFTFPPGRLTSPIVEKCRLAELDKSLRQSLKSEAECLDLRREIDDWKRQNF